MSGIKLQYLNGLGLVSKSKRVIKPGRHYDAYFPRPDRTDPFLDKDGSVEVTVEFCKKIVRKINSDTKRIAPLLKGATIEETCRNIFKFIYDHIQYEEDKPNVEQLRRPARAWADRKGDCDCMSIFASSILTNLNIPHSFRIVKMYGRSWFQHIYVIVPREGKSNMAIRDNYIVIDPVLDKFNQEAPKINHKKDFTMGNLAGVSGIPIQFLNGVDESLKFGDEFNGLEGFDGTSEELGREWDRRMKTHLVNTHRYITRNPQRVSAFYQPEKLAGAYKELIGAWDSESAREGALDRLSKIEESFLRPELQGLGDILNGPDDRLFGLINANLNEVMGLGDLGKRGGGGRRGGGGGGGKKPVFKKAAARKAARAASKPVVKRGPFTKIKQANKKIVAAHKKVGKKILEVKRKVDNKVIAIAKKIGKNIVKSATWPIIAGGLVAFKTNFGRIASRAYWGLFPKDEAMQHGVLPDYWDASNRLYRFILDIWTKKLMGAESTLRKAIISGRGAKVAKRGTSGLGNASELTTNGFEGLGVVGYDDAAALITAFAAILGPTLAFANKNMKGKQKTAGSKPEGEYSKDDTGEEEEVSQSEADHVEDNYNNEVVESEPEQEAEADGSIQEEESEQFEGAEEREYDQQFGDLGKKIKSKPETKVAKRVKKDKVSKKAAKKAKKATRKITKFEKKKPTKRRLKKLNKLKSRQLSPEEQSQKEENHIQTAEALQKLPKVKLIDKIKNGIKKLKAKKAANGKLTNGEESIINMSPENISQAADKLINKLPEEIREEAREVATKVRGEEEGGSSDSSVRYSKAADEEEKDAPTEGMGTGAKIGLVAIAGLALLAITKSGKKKEATNGLGDLGKFTKKKRPKNVYERNKIEDNVKKHLKKLGVKQPNGYDVENRKLNGTKSRVIKIK